MDRNAAAKQYRVAIDCYEAASDQTDLRPSLLALNALLDHPQLLSEEHRLTARLVVGDCHLRIGESEQAESEFLLAITEAKPSNSDYGKVIRAGATLRLATLLSQGHRWREAVNYFAEAAAYFCDNSDWQSEASVYRSVGFIWQNHGELDKARPSFERSIEVLKQHPPTPLHQEALFALGHCHHLSGEVQSAITYEERAFELARQFGDTESEHHLLHNLLEFAVTAGDHRRTIRYGSLHLRQARGSADVADLSRCIAMVGASYCETGQSRRALEMLDELFDLQRRDPKVEKKQLGACYVGKAQALVDLKEYEAAIDCLAKARGLLSSTAGEDSLLIRLNTQIKRETSGPLTVDCAHRVLGMVLAGTSEGVEHQNPQPVLEFSHQQFAASTLTALERDQFRKLHEELSGDILQVKWFSSSDSKVPDAMMLPTRFEYVDDVEAFEIKWAAFKRELAAEARSRQLQQEWDEIKGRFQRSEEPMVDHDSKLELLEYVFFLGRLARFHAETDDQEAVRRIGLHAADFMEIHTTDPVIAAVVWATRTRLMLAAHQVCESVREELAEVEVQHSLRQLEQTLALVDEGARLTVLSVVAEIWFECAHELLGKDAFSGLVDAVGENYGLLKDLDQMRYGLALAEAVDSAKGVELMDHAIVTKQATNPQARLHIDREFEIGRAVHRFHSKCPDYAACINAYGPFATYITDDVRTLVPGMVAFAVPVTTASSVRPPVMAFMDENLVVMRRDTGPAYIAAVMHEMQHRRRLTGQMFKTTDGRWLRVKRDLPIAAAESYLLLLREAQKDKSELITPNLRDLIAAGHSAVQTNGAAIHHQVENMLRYFDDLDTVETSASYACGAILIGVAQELLGESVGTRISSYISHLGLTDHAEALEFGRQSADLQL